jgi:hypothetical protein
MALAKIMENRYDFVLSFAGEDRAYVARVEEFLRFFGARVFYDERKSASLVGENLYEYLADIYEYQGAYCVMFISEHYVSKNWPRHERKFAEARAFRSHTPYILPVRLDDSRCPGIPATTGFIDGRKLSPSQVALVLMQKLGHQFPDRDADEFLLDRMSRWRITWDGNVHAWIKHMLVHLGDRPVKRMTFNIWATDDRPLELTNLQAFDRLGSLRTELIGTTVRRIECALYYRRPLQFGETIEIRRRYSLRKYYENITSHCRDTFRASIPIHDWQYEFVFPKNSQLLDFELFRKVGDNSFRAAYSTSVRAGCPVAHFSFRRPQVGTVLALAFRVSPRVS